MTRSWRITRVPVVGPQPGQQFFIYMAEYVEAGQVHHIAHYTCRDHARVQCAKWMKPHG